MNLQEILPLIDASIILETDSKKEKFDSKSTVPEKLMNHIVKSVKPFKKSILLSLAEPPKPKTLEELGYSFESGV